MVLNSTNGDAIIQMASNQSLTVILGVTEPIRNTKNSQEVIDLARKCLFQAQQNQARYYNKTEEDLVLLSTKDLTFRYENELQCYKKLALR